jgi:hypothetical protein
MPYYKRDTDDCGRTACCGCGDCEDHLARGQLPTETDLQRGSAAREYLRALSRHRVRTAAEAVASSYLCCCCTRSGKCRW